MSDYNEILNRLYSLLGDCDEVQKTIDKARLANLEDSTYQLQLDAQQLLLTVKRKGIENLIDVIQSSNQN